MPDTKVEAPAQTQTQKFEPWQMLDENENLVTVASFYQKDLDEINGTARTLLEEYSGIVPERAVQHVKDVVGLAIN